MLQFSLKCRFGKFYAVFFWSIAVQAGKVKCASNSSHAKCGKSGLLTCHFQRGKYLQFTTRRNWKTSTATAAMATHKRRTGRVCYEQNTISSWNDWIFTHRCSFVFRKHFSFKKKCCASHFGKHCGAGFFERHHCRLPFYTFCNISEFQCRVFTDLCNSVKQALLSWLFGRQLVADVCTSSI